MSIDVSQFYQVFFEESLEGLDVMEAGLLSLDVGTADDEAINTIFRAAHSIKGGSGTFGFSDVAEFTHAVETLLDEMRGHKRAVTRAGVDLLLRSVDVLRNMLMATRDGEATDKPAAEEVLRKLQAELDESPQDKGPPQDANKAPPAPGVAGWKIYFRPYSHLLSTGNDPVRLFRELSSLGRLTVTADASALPPFAELDPEELFLAWNLKLEGAAGFEAVREVFAWVEDDCELTIEPLDEPAATDAALPCSHKDGTERTPGAQEPITLEAPERRSGGERRRTDRRSASAGESTSIRVSIDKIDAIINMVGELVITQSMLSQFSGDFDMSMLEGLRDGLAQLERNTRELQETVLKVRMLPISFSFSRFPRLVHDLSAKLGKRVELKLSGEQTELDKTVLEKISDPLVHLVRNSLDHGIETPDQRRAEGKSETGTVHLNAYHEGGNIVIEVEDDGAGLDTKRIIAKARERGLLGEDESVPEERVYDFIFSPGFSTASTVSDVSGRGVGMDVVRRNIKELGGTIEVRSTLGQGSCFSIRLPLTLAILDGQLVRVGDQTYIIPLVSIAESLQISKSAISSVAGKAELYQLRDQYLPIVRLHGVFGVQPDKLDLDKGLLVVVEGDGQRAGLHVDDLLAQQQVVIKSLESNFRRVDGISGATILGDGTVAMILDVPGLLQLSRGAPAPCIQKIA